MSPSTTAPIMTLTRKKGKGKMAKMEWAAKRKGRNVKKEERVSSFSLGDLSPEVGWF